MQFDFDAKPNSGIKKTAIDVLSRLLKNHMETQVVEDIIKELKDPPPRVAQKAVDEVFLTLLFYHEILP